MLFSQGEHQTVIKPLGKAFQSLQGVSGSTILGNGNIALILDVPTILRKISELPEPVAQSFAF
jgi:two-component system chemotaxis sensor kinase CheA